MVGHEVPDPTLNKATIVAVFGNTKSPSAKGTSSPESELHWSLV